jgi:hypothetical protein
MASADFSKRIPWPCGIGSLIARHVWRSPRVRRNPFPRLPPDLPMSHPSGYRASLSMARLPCEHRPCIRFLFVGSEFCLRLPPDLASRQRPCLQLTVPTTTACSGQKAAPVGGLLDGCCLTRLFHRQVSRTVRTGRQRPCRRRYTWIPRRISRLCAACWPAGWRTAWRRCSPGGGPGRWRRR